MTRRTIAMLAGGLVLSAAGAALAAPSFWTAWFSEEGQNWQSCGTYGVTALQFSGRYSDNIALGCSPWIFGSLTSDVDTGGSYWSDAFSEEGDSGIEKTQCALFPDGHQECDTIPTGSNLHVCFGGFGPNNKGVVTGMACYGRYCDNLRLQCTKPTSGHLGSCAWSGWFSEEQHQVDFGPGFYVTGVECSGSYCDNMRFYVCSAQW